jgi:putative radical SAM enzyme (TIGR03279 family)
MLARKSPFYHSGLRSGDTIVAINGEPLYSELDFQFFSADHVLHLDIRRSNRSFKLCVERQEGQFSGVTLEELPIGRCTNRCIFCFIDQMPAGLRRSLYVKDEDIRLSLLNGNYVTLSNFKQRDLERIVRIGLSPLYISVHATDSSIRRRMLGNGNAPDIVPQLDFLAGNGICFHTQIVVCPSWNDGGVLKKTVADLLDYGTALGSVAVVPVGLTRFGNTGLVPVDRQISRKTCRIISGLSDKSLKRDGFRKVFLADEFFIKADLPIPDKNYYGDYPQIENGVGLVRQLLDSTITVKRPRILKKTNIAGQRNKRLLITSVSAEPYIRMAVDKIFTGNHDASLQILPVPNRFFGETVTVAGLLTASDIIRNVNNACRHSPYNEIIIPGVVFNYAGFTLDGFSADRISKKIGKQVRVLQSITELRK